MEGLELLAAAGEGVLAGELLAGAHARPADGDDDERLEAAPAPVDDDRVTDRAERRGVVDDDRVGLRRHHAPEVAGPPEGEGAAHEVGPDGSVLAAGEHVDLAGVVTLGPERAERRVVDADVVLDEGAGRGLGVGELGGTAAGGHTASGTPVAPGTSVVGTTSVVAVPGVVVVVSVVAVVPPPAGGDGLDIGAVVAESGEGDGGDGNHRGGDPGQRHAPPRPDLG